MDSPHTGSLNQSVELLRVETNLFNLYIQGKPYHPTVESLQLHRTHTGEWIDTGLQIQSLSNELVIEQISIFSPNQGGLIRWQTGDKSFPLFYETQSYELVIEKKQPCALAFHHENMGLRQAIKPLGQSLLTGILNFRNEVGLTELELRLNGRTVCQLQLEIFPSKMDYKQDYQMILHDVNQQIYNLSFDFLRKTYNLTGLKETTNQSLTEFFAILQHVFNQLIQAVDRIQASPHYKLEKEMRVLDSARVKKTGKENIAYLSKRTHLLIQDDQQGFIPVHGHLFYPSHALETKRRIQYDTMENRFVRWVLQRISRKLKDLKGKLLAKDRMQDPYLHNKITYMQTQLQRLLRLDFLNVGEMKDLSVSLVLQMAPGYREVYRNYLMLMKGLSIQSDLFRLSMKDLAQLYEYWCFLKIHDLLSRKYELLKQDIIKVNRTGVFMTLDKSQSARMMYRNPSNGEVFTLYYNTLPSKDGSATLGQKPDNVLTLKKNESSIEYKYIFDAKYRLNPAYEGTYYYNKYMQPGPEEDDINTMHRYRDAIVYAEKNSEQYERTMFGAYVLFPYHDEERFREHRFYKSIELVNVGAFPFLPGSTRLMEEFLDEIILDSPENAYERAVQPRGSGEYYANKYMGKNVLVGCMSSMEQLDVALKHKFYHTPLENITHHKLLTQLEYVALYQSRKFFGKSNDTVGVQYYGKIKDWKIVKRGEITVIPSKHNPPDKLYVVFEIEEWITRDVIIVPGGHGVRSITFTSKYIFDRALEIAELKLATEEELLQWREARRRGHVKVKLDHEYLDDAKKVMSVEVEIE